MNECACTQTRIERAQLDRISLVTFLAFSHICDSNSRLEKRAPALWDFLHMVVLLRCLWWSLNCTFTYLKNEWKRCQIVTSTLKSTTKVTMNFFMFTYLSLAVSTNILTCIWYDFKHGLYWLQFVLLYNMIVWTNSAS